MKKSIWMPLVTIAVAAVVSLTGLVSFVGLLAPHGARMLSKNNRSSTMLLSCFAGSILLCGARLEGCQAAVGHKTETQIALVFQKFDISGGSYIGVEGTEVVAVTIDKVFQTCEGVTEGGTFVISVAVTLRPGGKAQGTREAVKVYIG